MAMPKADLQLSKQGLGGKVFKAETKGLGKRKRACQQGMPRTNSKTPCTTPNKDPFFNCQRDLQRQ